MTRSTNTKNLKLRVLKACDNLPSDYLDIIAEIYPQYSDSKGRTKVSNVKRCIITDEVITSILEELSRNYVSMKAKMKLKGHCFQNQYSC